MCPLEDSTTEKHPRAIDSIPEQNRQAIEKNIFYSINVRFKDFRYTIIKSDSI